MTVFQTVRRAVRRSVRFAAQAPAAMLKMLIRGYQLTISPMLGPRCRFYPSCSDYAIEAIDRHGGLSGLRLALWRLLRCQPWDAGGIDEVPANVRPLSRFSRGRWPEALRESDAGKL
jgi:uncharacterized protein